MESHRLFTIEITLEKKSSTSIGILLPIIQYSAIYNYRDYASYNADLVATYGENPWKLLQHFINSGMKEGRQASSQFNLAAYKANNPDLVALFGDDNIKYYEHSMTNGKAEGRIAI